MIVKSLAWIGKIVAAGLMISFLSIWTTGYIVTSYVESVLKQFELPIEVPPIAMSGVWGKLWGSDPLLTSGIDQENGSVNSGSEPDVEEVFGGIQEEPGSGNGEGNAPADGSAEGGAPTGTEGGLDGTETVVKTDDIESVKGEMSEEDKAQLFELLMMKLPPESWLEISEYMEGGLTEQELTSVQQIMAQHLDTSEYEQMMEILKKY
ncbi:hypothetical protein [Paenibacillus paeoniae]|uniref:Spore coat protein n=1 Tax=Paenibacillus paeoniae TaxID=2292705 RepID=A0A371P7S2_9BACL|nr:hypothetical protein [Paenibacillus paeoniae]REK71997.1 hypothetical protein DX130_20100 [Paenibacillus paeoniae]